MTNNKNSESKETQTRKQGLLILGLAIMALGLALANAAILALGAVFFIIGLAQRSEHDINESSTFPIANIDKDAFYDLYIAGTNLPFGQISGTQLIFLIDNLEEEFLEDQDYAISQLTLDYLHDQGADPDLIALLNRSLGDNEELTIVWKQR